jgi:hypothetical protein
MLVSPRPSIKGYGELAEQDFFQLEDEDITTYNLADKCQSLLQDWELCTNVPFNDFDEMPIVRYDAVSVRLSLMF